MEQVGAAFGARTDALRRTGFRNWRESQRVDGLAQTPLVIVVDELAELTLRNGSPDARAIGALDRIARQGLGLGVILVCGLQRPDAQAMGPARGQFGAGVSFHVRTVTESEVVFGPGEHHAALLPSIPGRAVLSDGRGPIVPGGRQRLID